MLDSKETHLQRALDLTLDDNEKLRAEIERLRAIGGVAKGAMAPIRAVLLEWVNQTYIDADECECSAAAYAPDLYVRSMKALGVQAFADTPSPWQPIETAPKDGPSFLVWVPENFCTYLVTARGSELLIFGGGWRDRVQRASLWMPRPSGPPSMTSTERRDV